MNTCTIYGYIMLGDGTPVEGVQVIFSLGDSPIMTSSGYAISRDTVITTTSSTGYFAIELVQNIEVFVQIPFIGFRERILVPTAESALIWSLCGIDMIDVDEGGDVNTPTNVEVNVDNTNNW